jgi:hypothetical protein
MIFSREVIHDLSSKYNKAMKLGFLDPRFPTALGEILIFPPQFLDQP